MTKIKRIPYGKSDFETVNILGEYYVDKTMFIPEIERTPFVFLIRPRRFGKSLFLSTLRLVSLFAQYLRAQHTCNRFTATSQEQ